MAPIPEGSAEKERMMALQLPEPDYYTLAEVLKRWDITEAVLFRLAREGKIRIGFIPPYSFPVTVFDSCVDDDGNMQTWEISTEDLGRGTLYTLSDTSKNIIFCNGPILLLPDGVPNLERPCDQFQRDFFPLEMELWPYKTIPWLKSFPDSWFLMVPVSAQVEINNEWHKNLHGSGELLMSVAVENKCRVPINLIIIPMSEIHRIEHQHEAAEEAAADDVLGTKEKEKLQGIIAAMAQILASKSHAYKNGDNPNAHAIAEAVVETGLVDRAVGTVQKEIGTACTWAKKWSGK